MFCAKCQTEKPNDPSHNSWCNDCRKKAREEAILYRQTHPKKLYSGRTYESRDLILREMGYKDYRDYLRSPLWRQVKRKVFAIKGRNCFCGEWAYTVHHNRYHKNDLLGKTLIFLEPICKKHHTNIEFSKKGRKLELCTAKDRCDNKIERQNHIFSSIIGSCDADDVDLSKISDLLD